MYKYEIFLQLLLLLIIIIIIIKIRYYLSFSLKGNGVLLIYLLPRFKFNP